MAKFKNNLIDAAKFSFKEARYEFSNGIFETEDKELIDFLSSISNVWTKIADSKAKEIKEEVKKDAKKQD